MAAEGMVAVVQSLRDAGLAVTLLDSSRNRFSLIPTVETPLQLRPEQMRQQYQRTLLGRQHSAVETDSTDRCDSSQQATDGRYVSIYQTTHGNLVPTSPQIHVTEFPPQRAELCPGARPSLYYQSHTWPEQPEDLAYTLHAGHGNFEVGGLGSGETGQYPNRAQPPGSYRGGLNWVDRGAVCSPRPSQRLDAFASSLRKYPPAAVSPDRSTEVVERLINYSQPKSLSRSSPVRGTTESEAINQNNDRSPKRAGNGDLRSRSGLEEYPGNGERPGSRIDEYPTRDGRPRRDELDRRHNTHYDVKNVRDPDSRVSRAKESGRPYMQFYDYGYREGSDMLPLQRKFMEGNIYQYGMRDGSEMHSYERKFMENGSSNSVHTETQAAVKMVSREVATTPRCEALKKNVAVPHSTSTSTFGAFEGAVSDQTPSQMELTPTKIVSFKSIQATSSSIELITTRKLPNPRRSQSEDDLRRKHFEEGIVELIGNLAATSKAKDDDIKDKILKDMWVKLHRVLENVEQQKNRDRALINISKKIKKGPILIPVRYDAPKDCSRKKIKKWSELDVYRAALTPIRISNANTLEDVVKKWVNCLPIKSRDFVGKPVDKLQASDALVRKVLKLLTAKTQFDCESLKRQILNVLFQAPIGIMGKRKINFINSSVNALLSKLIDITPNKFTSANNRLEFKSDNNNRHINQIEYKVKEWVSNETVEFFEKHKIELNKTDLNEIRTELIDLIKDFIYEGYEGSHVKEEVFKKDIVSYLAEYNIKSDDSIHLANALLKPMKQKTFAPSKYAERNLVVYLNPSANTQRRSTMFFNASANTDAYKDELCEQIDDWLTALPIQIDKLDEKEVRDAIVNDLAEDILERQKYLQFNSTKTTDANELEYLKYQIYKWINKVVDDENINILEHASDLMERIRSVPVPKLTMCNTKILNVEIPNTSNTLAESNNTCRNEEGNKMCCNNSKRRPSILKNKNDNLTINAQDGTEAQPSCCPNVKSPLRITIEQLNDEYEEFLRNWVQQIPIPASTPPEQELSTKLRGGVYNGVWKALTKLKFDPAAFHNTFYYQDMLDAEIESLLDCLPKSDTLDAKKAVLKAQLLERTRIFNEQVMKVTEPATFKNSLVENLATSVPRNPNDGDVDNAIKKYEDLRILSIVDDYIVLINYEEENKVKANAFRKKLLNKVEKFVEDLKRSHGKELKDINMELYLHDIIDAMRNVPQPSDDSMKEEAEDIMLGIEVEHWFNDLPLIPNDDYVEQLQRRRLRESLTKKIAAIQKSNLGACASEKAIKDEIIKFLEIVPLQQDKLDNINFIANELLNRIINKKREQGSTPRSVVFEEDIRYQSYAAFSKELPHCSSFSCDQSTSASRLNSSAPNDIQYHPTPTQNYNDSSVWGGVNNNLVPPNFSIHGSRGYQSFEADRPFSSSMHPSQIPVQQNPPNSQRSDFRWSPFTEVPSKAPSPYAPTPSPYNSPNFEEWVSLEEVPMPPEMRSPLQQSEERKLQQIKPSTNVNSQAPNRPGQASCCVENKANTSQVSQVVQDQISRINEAAVGLSSNRSQTRDRVSLASVSRGSAPMQRDNINQTNARVNQSNARVLNPSLQGNEVLNQTDLNRSHQIPNQIQTCGGFNQTGIPSNVCAGGIQPNMPTLQQNMNSSFERSRVREPTQYSSQQTPIQNVPNIATEYIQSPQQNVNIPTTARNAEYSQQIQIAPDSPHRIQTPQQNISIRQDGTPDSSRSSRRYSQQLQNTTNSSQQTPFQNVPNIAAEYIQSPQQNVNIPTIGRNTEYSQQIQIAPDSPHRIQTPQQNISIRQDGTPDSSRSSRRYSQQLQNTTNSSQQTPFQNVPNIPAEYILSPQQNANIPIIARNTEYSPQIQIAPDSPQRIQSPQQNINIRQDGTPYSPRSSSRYQQPQNATNISSRAPPQQNISPSDALPTGTSQLQNIPEIVEPPQMEDQQIQTQPTGSSYGQPQGFSTPQQEPVERSPPRVRRKPHDHVRHRSGHARRRLDLDDDNESDDDDECPCITRFRQRFDDDCPCYYPFSYPFPYFF